MTLVMLAQVREAIHVDQYCSYPGGQVSEANKEDIMIVQVSALLLVVI